MDNGLNDILQQVDRLCDDARLSCVREWKDRTGGLAIGYQPIFAPRELLHAQGVLPVGLMGGGETLEVIRGDAYFQSYICRLPRSTLELAHSGRLDCLDGMLFPATCDVLRNLSGMWRILFPTQLVIYLDLPQSTDRAVGEAFLRQALEDLAAELAARGARPLADETLRRSLARYNENRRLLRRLFALRQRAPWKVPTSELYRLQRAGLVIPVEQHTRLLAAYCRTVESASHRQPRDEARVVLVGCFCEQPPLALLRAVEQSGCYVVDDDLVQVQRWHTREVPSGGDPLANYVRSSLHHALPTATRFAEGSARRRGLVNRVRRCGAEGVIFCSASFCDPALLDQPLAAAELDRAGIPWTAFQYSENSGQTQMIREQIGTFADSLRLWSSA